MPEAAAKPGFVPGQVSVVIGAYNCAPYIEATLDSVLAQRGVALEVIVVDDGSTDDTWSVLQRYGRGIVVLRQANGGVPAARNAGLERARGEFIALMDHDDLCEPDRLAVQLEVMRAHPEVMLTCTEFSAFSDAGPLATRYSSQYYGQCAAERGGIVARFPKRIEMDLSAASEQAGAARTTVLLGHVYEEIAAGNFVHPPTVMFRAGMLPEVGRFDTQLRYMCDWDWLVRASRCGEFAFIDLPLLRYRRSPGQISSERGHPKASVDTLRVLEMIHARDPSLAARNPARVRRSLAGVVMDAAYANAESRPGLALSLTARAVLRHGAFDAAALRIVARALLPTALLKWLRRRRLTAAAA